MAKIALLLLFVLAIPAVSVAQDRSFSPRRLPLPPQLIENPDSHIASGIAQAPTGYPVIIGSESVPRGSTVGLYGSQLRINGIDEVLILANGKEYSLRVVVNRPFFPKLELMTFRLPPEITGEVLVSAIGLTYSNWVKFDVGQ
jgi:hypothetical protein